MSYVDVLCVECDVPPRTHRLTHDRHQPELANEDITNWSRYLHQEAIEAGCNILDTTQLSVR